MRKLQNPPDDTVISTALASLRVNNLGAPLCTYEKEDSTLCDAPARRGMRFCRSHGDELAPLSSERYIEGRYKPSVPHRLLNDFKRARTDTDLLQLEDNIALYDARILYLMRQDKVGDTYQAWLDARKALWEYKKALHDDDHDAAALSLYELERVLLHRADTRALWDEIDRITLHKKALVESERRRKLEAAQSAGMIPYEKVEALTDAFVSLIEQHVSNPAEAYAMFEAIEQLTGQQQQPSAKALAIDGGSSK